MNKNLHLLCAFPTTLLCEGTSTGLFSQVDSEARNAVIKAILTGSVISAFNLAFERNQIEIE